MESWRDCELCVVVLDAPKREKFVYMGIKPTVLIISEEDLPEGELERL